MSRSITASEVAQHNTPSSAWVIIEGGVFDVTKFVNEHPGGKKVLLNVAGKDASKQFQQFHKPEVLVKYSPQLKIGVVSKDGSAAPSAPPSPKAAPPKKSSTSSTDRFFGELVPFGDPSWYQGLNSPYYNDSHRRFRKAMREFVDKEIAPFAHEWDEAKSIPKALYGKCYKAGILPGVLGIPWEKLVPYLGDHIAGGVKPSEWDHFHELILSSELCKPASASVSWALMGGLSIGLPAIFHYGSDYLRKKTVAPCGTGEKVIALAITEPEAGSDVAGLKTSAVKTPDGKHYIVNGQKKWITNGVFADFFTTAVRTGGSGHGGVSMLLIERGAGVTTTQMKCMGVWASGTAYVTFEDVKVPVENLIGKEGEGFKYVMENFNHERYSTAIGASSFARVCVEESFRYACKRKTFGKLLIEHPVIRYKLGNMIRQVETTWALIESIAYQLNTLSFQDAQKLLGGQIAMLKAHAGIVMEFCAREAAQIFGGLAYTRGGQGEKIERIYREGPAYRVPAGSEEIMLDLGVRQAFTKYQQTLKAKL